MWINVNHPGSVAHGPGLGESSESYEEKGADECVKELSMSESQEEDEDKEDKKSDLVRLELVTMPMATANSPIQLLQILLIFQIANDGGGREGCSSNKYQNNNIIIFSLISVISKSGSAIMKGEPPLLSHDAASSA